MEYANWVGKYLYDIKESMREGRYGDAIMDLGLFTSWNCDPEGFKEQGNVVKFYMDLKDPRFVAAVKKAPLEPDSYNDEGGKELPIHKAMLIKCLERREGIESSKKHKISSGYLRDLISEFSK